VNKCKYLNYGTFITNMITALLVSVNYSDYLEAALPCNALQFDEIIVLTIESDKACQDLCSKYSNVKCLVFPDKILKKNRKQFNKGAILNAGLRYLNRIKYSDWLVLTDSDIIFPENFKELLLGKKKDKNLLYGMNRRYCSELHILHQYLNTKDVELLTTEEGIPLFIGFCQIFVYQANKFNFVEDCDAENSDIIFLTHFSKQFKRFMDSKMKVDKFPKSGISNSLAKDPVFNNLSGKDFVIHLGESLKNWKCRKTKLFT